MEKYRIVPQAIKYLDGSLENADTKVKYKKIWAIQHRKHFWEKWQTLKLEQDSELTIRAIGGNAVSENLFELKELVNHLSINVNNKTLSASLFSQ